jgi:hypothetical protein
MPTYFARKAGNINATDVWATAPAGTASAVTFAAGDVLMANSFAITVNVSTDLGGAGQVRNDTTGGATAGGSFTLSNGVTLTANVFSSASVACLIFNGVSPNSATLVGNITNPSNGVTSATNSSTGTLNITGNVTGGTGGSSHGATNASTGTITITGNVTGGGGLLSHGATNASGTLNVIGNCTGGNSTGTGAFQNSTGILSIIGTVTASQTAAGVAGANVQQTTLLTGPFITELNRGTAPVYCAAWRWNSSLSNSTYLEVATSNFGTKRNLYTADNITGMPAASNVKTGVTYGPVGELTGTFDFVQSPSAADIQAAVWSATTRTITGGLVDTATTLTNAPTVPTPSQIASQVRTELSTELSRLDVATSTRSTLTTGDLPSVPSAASVASAVRTELTELSNLDASVSSRLASAAYTAPTSAPTAAAVATAVWGAATKEITGGTVTTLTNSPTVPSAASIRAEIDSNSTQLAAIKAKTDGLNLDRVNNTATLSHLGNLLAQANS